jgi:hypothetical protein
MNTKHASNCEELRSRFEGREAIYVEKGLLRVRVTDIHARGGFRIGADAEEIPTPGLGTGMFHQRRLSGASPVRWRFRAGYLTTFSAQSWQMGYGGWSLYFSPVIVQSIVEFAAQLAVNADPEKANRELGLLLRNADAHEPSQPVFPNAVVPGSGEFRGSDSPPIAVQVKSGWILCPCCDMRFSVSDPGRWNGKEHATCGQRLIIKAEP